MAGPAAAELRRMSIDSVHALKRKAPSASSSYWVSPSGYNYGRWAARGFNLALGILEHNEPQAAESGRDYLRRIAALISAQRDEYRADAEDEDGACSGALDAALWAVRALIPEAPAVAGSAENGARSLAPDAEWEVVYRDMFDRETPPHVDVTGRSLAGGLMELWARHLCETVRPGGVLGFSRFHLRWESGHITVEGTWDGAVRLREWVFGAKAGCPRGYIQEGDARLLSVIATTHARLVLEGRTSEDVLAAAVAAEDSQDFETRLAEL